MQNKNGFMSFALQTAKPPFSPKDLDSTNEAMRTAVVTSPDMTSLIPMVNQSLHFSLAFYSSQFSHVELTDTSVVEI